MSDYINIKLALSNSIEAFSIDTDDNDYSFYPNASTVARLFFNYRAISFSLSLAPNFLPGNDDDAIRGRTKGTGFGAGLSYRQWFTELSYSRTKGYYLKNTEDYVPGWAPGDPYLQIPALVSTNFEGATGYNFNRRFSRSSVTNQTERQLKSAGTFVPRLLYRYYIINDKSIGTTQKSNNFQLIGTAEYQYTHILKDRFYISAGAGPGFGFVSTRLLTQDPVGDVLTHFSSAVFRWDGRVGVGYNDRNLFAGFYLETSSSRYKQKNTTAVNDNKRTYYQLFVGYRFTAPRRLRKTYDRVSEKIRSY